MKLLGYHYFFASNMNKFLQQPSTGLGCIVHWQWGRSKCNRESEF